jgi:hypothetical protein
MNQFKLTTWMMLTHSMVSLFFTTAIIVFFTVFQVFITSDQTSTIKAMLGSVLISLTLSVFIGVYIAGGLQKLKQNYLWSISKKYKYTLLISFLFLALVFNLLTLPILYINIKHIPLLFALPFCVTIFSTYLVLGSNLIQKVFIPAIPMLLVQLYRFNLSYNTLILILIAAATLLILLMFFGNAYKTAVKQTSKEQQSLESMSFATTGLSSKFITNFNFIIGAFLSKKIVKKNRNIDWAIIMPHSKLALFSLFYVVLIGFSVLFITDDGGKMIKAFTVLFLGSSLISLIMESRLLIRQTRTIAHVFNGVRHRQLKNKILFSVDINIFFNSAVFILGIVLFAQLFSIPLNIFEMLIIAFIMLCFALAYYPFLLCFQWIDISFLLICAVCIYVAGLFLLLHYAKPYLESENITWYLLLTFLGCLFIRVITQTIFWHKPYEQLLKNK